MIAFGKQEHREHNQNSCRFQSDKPVGRFRSKHNDAAGNETEHQGECATEPEVIHFAPSRFVTSGTSDSSIWCTSIDFRSLSIPTTMKLGGNVVMTSANARRAEARPVSPPGSKGTDRRRPCGSFSRINRLISTLKMTTVPDSA